MGRGLVIGSTRLFVIAEYLLQSADRSPSSESFDEPAELQNSHPKFRTRAFTAMELTEARKMLVRMGLLPPRDAQVGSLPQNNLKEARP